MARRLERCSIDLVRFGYLIRAALAQMELPYRKASIVSGVSVRQISDAVNGQPIAAGSTLMLASMCGVSLEELYSGATLERLQKILKVRKERGHDDEKQLCNALQNQTVTPDVKRETPRQEASNDMAQGGASQ